MAHQLGALWAAALREIAAVQEALSDAEDRCARIADLSEPEADKARADLADARAAFTLDRLLRGDSAKPVKQQAAWRYINESARPK